MSTPFFERPFGQYIQTRYFWLNLIAMLLLSLTLIWIVTKSLSAYTHHGESIVVPELRGLTMQNALDLLDSQNLDYIVADSGFTKEMLPDAIIEQFPRPGSKVKEDRRIYLTVNARVAPLVGIPNVVYNSLENAIIQLESAGLLVGERKYVPDPAKNAVLDVKLRGITVEPGTKVPKGTPIDLVLGNGIGNTMVDVPVITGLTYNQARITVLGYQLNVGAVVKDPGITNMGEAIVYKQSPNPADGDTQIAIGQPIDIWLQENPEIKKQALPAATPPAATAPNREDSLPLELKNKPAAKEAPVD